jgi:hypothetical protein
MNLERLYKSGDIVKKREIIGSIYPENLTIDGFGVRTARLNEAVSLIYSLGAGSSLKKKQDKRKKSVLSCLVTPSIQFSNKFLGDLTRLAKLAVRHPMLCGSFNLLVFNCETKICEYGKIKL